MVSPALYPRSPSVATDDALGVGGVLFVLLLATVGWAAGPGPSTDASDAVDADDVAAENGSVDDDAKPWDRVGWGWAGLPAVNFNSDEGFGFGVVGSIYRYNGGTQPYKFSVNLNIFSTTKAIHSHFVQLDWLEVGDRPLRLTIRPGLAATRTNNFCGVGWDVDCSTAPAEEAANTAFLSDDARDDLVRRYNLVRYINPYFRFNARYALDPMPHRLELFAGYRLEGLIPGDFSTDEPFEGSLYAQTFPGGERGWDSSLSVGMMLDNRDNEPAPVRGYWIEGSIRGASKFWGSTYDNAGANITLRAYTPLGTERLVFANRVVFDGLVGETHHLGLATPGGFQQYYLYGSFLAGRGIRLRRYIGKVKLMEQAELRATVWSPTVGGVPIDLTVLGFGDVGVVSAEWEGLGEALAHPLPGTGGGLRVAIDKNFIVRVDVGVSPLEDWSPSVYIDLNNTF